MKNILLVNGNIHSSNLVNDYFWKMDLLPLRCGSKPDFQVLNIIGRTCHLGIVSYSFSSSSGKKLKPVFATLCKIRSKIVQVNIMVIGLHFGNGMGGQILKSYYPELGNQFVFSQKDPVN